MSYVLAGYGKFGRLAMQRLAVAFPGSSVLVLEKDLDLAPRDVPAWASFFKADAVSFLLDSPLLADEDLVIPTVPFHLAAAYLTAKVPSVQRIAFPEEVIHRVPNPYTPDPWSLCSSYANFMCPDDCPAGRCCTITGEEREPLYGFLESLIVPGFDVVVVRSGQILPGVGGYRLGDLKKLAESLGPGRHILATACQCHAIMTALHMDALSKK